MRVILVVAALVAWAAPAVGQPAPAPVDTAPVDTAPADPAPVDPAPAPAADAADAAFGPLVVIDAILVSGNRATADRVILRALPVAVGDVLRVGDPRLVNARFKVLALGFFRDVKLELRRSARRGHVVLLVTVEERGTVVLNRLWFGTSTTSPWWFGADLDERNFVGTGVGVGGGAVFAGHGDVPGSRDQWAAELRVASETLGASRWGARGALTVVHGSEPYRVAGGDHDTDAIDFGAFPYRRIAGRFAATYGLTGLSRLTLGGRVELVRATLPTAPTRTLPDGRVVPVELDLEPGDSRIVTASLAFDRDTRPDPALPRTGSHAAAAVELGSTLLGGSYDYATILARYDRWWPVRRTQAIALRLAGGVVVGRAPRFDRIQVGDVDRMLTPRALGMVVAPNTSPDFLGTGTGGIAYGDVGGSAVVEWSIRLFRRRQHVYGGDLFVGGGLWGIANADALRTRDRSAWRSLPVDLVFDAGLRVDTEVGIFELSLANALGRVPP
jgi:outer membrane protein insertion porin family